MPAFDYQKSYRNEFVKKVLSEIKKSTAEGKGVDQIVQDYENELANINVQTQTEPEPKNTSDNIQTQLDIHDSQKASQPGRINLSNWLKENNILLMLYTGALFIVISAAIFVAFNWTDISNLIKFLGILVVTLSFIVSGLLIYLKIEKLKIAGTVFCAVGALMIPFVGLGFYNFYNIFYLDYTVIWSITSLISLLTYLSFLKLFKNTFYKYISVVATTSFFFALTQGSDLNITYKIFSMLLTSYTLLFLSYWSNEKPNDKTTANQKLFYYSSQFVMPISLLVGLAEANRLNLYYNYLTFTILVLSALYYTIISVGYFKKYAHYLVALFFLLVLDNLFTLFSDVEGYKSYILLLVTYPISIVFINIKKSSRAISDLAGDFIKLTNLALVYLAVFIYFTNLYLVRFGNSFSSIDSSTVYKATHSFEDYIWYFLIALGFNLYYFYKEKSSLTAVLINLIIIVFTHNICYVYIKTGFWETTLLTATALSIVNYIIYADSHWKNKIGNLIGELTFLDLSTFVGFFSLTGSIFLEAVGRDTNFLTLINIFLIALFLIYRGYYENNSWLTNLSSVVMVGLVVRVLNRLNIEEFQIPVFISAYSALIVVTEIYSNRLKQNLNNIVTKYANTTLISTAIVNVFYLADFNKGEFFPKLELMTSFSYLHKTTDYTSTIIYYFILISWGLFSSAITVYSLEKENRWYKYLAFLSWLYSFIWMLPLLRAGSNLFIYIPIGLYFLIIGHFEKANNQLYSRNLELIGFVILFLSLFIKLMGGRDFIYPILMGAVGLSLISWGITSANHRYSKTGILFVITTLLAVMYIYLVSMPRWIITSITGFLIMGFSIYLLYKKNSKQ